MKVPPNFFSVPGYFLACRFALSPISSVPGRYAKIALATSLGKDISLYIRFSITEGVCAPNIFEL